jgi:hypothetical protein
MRKLAKLSFIILLCLAVPGLADAGVYNDVRSYVSRSLSDISSWWNKGVIGLSKEGTETPPDPENPGEGTPDETTPSETFVPGMCQVAQQPPVIICEQGSGFLCVNTPEPGVSGDSIIIKGSIDKLGSVPASITVSVQHDYTKNTVFVDTSNPDTADCWNSTLSGRPFCVGSDGFYSVKIPLSDLGPYTIAVGATRLSGGSVTQTARTSRVQALTMADGQVAFAPDVRTTATVSDPYINVTVSLLGECSHCDFIGASTFGVTVTVENVMRDSEGNTSRILCATNVEQGGQGRFIVGVPVGPGKNELKVTACNAAMEGSCPAITGIAFEGRGGFEGIEIINPPPAPSYSSEEYTTIPFEFKLKGSGDATACANVTFNRQPSKEVCPASDGRFTLTLDPQIGVNVVTVDNDDMGIHIPWVFGWGNIDSPFESSSNVKDGLLSKNAFQLAIPAKTFTEIVGPMISNILSSDELGLFIGRAFSNSDDSTSNEDESIIIPKCGATGSLGDLKITGVSDTKIGKAKMEGISFEKNKLTASINADNISMHFDLIKEGKDPVPLRISFRKAVIDVVLEVKDDGLVLLSSPHTDCDFKDERYCENIPSALIPQNFIGDATPFGGFVKCDTSGRSVSGEIERLCDAMNSLNAQTGLINAAVLDAVNSMLYCSGSKALTKLAKSGLDQKSFSIGYENVIGPVDLPIGLNFEKGFGIDSSGLLLTGGVVAGSSDLFKKMPDALKIPSVGVVYDRLGRYLTQASTPDANLRFAFSADMLNRVLFALNSASPNILDIDVSEPFFNKAGFDFVKECDAFVESGGDSAEAYSPLCNVRPRVSELLGTPLSKYGYFEPKQPLLVRIHGNSALPPHISVVNIDEIPVVSRGSDSQSTSNVEPGDNLLDVQIGGLTMSFYALEVDETGRLDDYGNLPIKLGPAGDPIIESMRPEDPDPSHGQIASFELTILLAVEIGDVETDPTDPSQFTIMIRPLADRSRLVISPVAGSNTTTIPPVALISALREKLQYAINIFSAPEDAIRIPVPKELSFDSLSSNDLVKLMGLKTLNFGSEGLALDLDSDLDYFSAAITAKITQLFHRDGVETRDTLPH